MWGMTKSSLTYMRLLTDVDLRDTTALSESAHTLSRRVSMDNTKQQTSKPRQYRCKPRQYTARQDSIATQTQAQTQHRNTHTYTDTCIPASMRQFAALVKHKAFT